MHSLKPYFSLLAVAALCFIGGCDANAQVTRSGTTLVNNSSSTDDNNYSANVILAGGCFWCTEGVFEGNPGVGEVVSGYIGGTRADANYETVCSYKRPIPGKPLHAEAVLVNYDPDVISLEGILSVFFKTHDPTSLYRQGNDAGPQYRTSIFYKDDEQKQIAQAYIDKLNKEKAFRGKVVTLLEDGSGQDETSTFYPAEEYHQDYYRKNPYAGYCQMVVRAKVQKGKNLFRDKNLFEDKLKLNK